jgi:hypothetical protein
MYKTGFPNDFSFHGYLVLLKMSGEKSDIGYHERKLKKLILINCIFPAAAVPHRRDINMVSDRLIEFVFRACRVSGPRNKQTN